MRQNINFYTDEFKPKFIFFTFYHGVCAVLLMILTIFIISFLRNEELDSVVNKNKQLMSINNIKDQSVLEEKVTLSMEMKKEKLKNEVDRVKAEIRRIKLLSILVESENLIDKTLFSDLFSVFSDKSNTSISLSEINIYDRGKEVLINGLASDKDVIPKYLSLVKEDDYFERSAFGLIEIKRLNSKNIYQFSMKRKGNDVNSEQLNRLFKEHHKVNEGG